MSIKKRYCSQNQRSRFTGENSVDTIITRPNRLIKKYSTITKYQAFNSFLTFKRPSTMSIQAFLNEFNKHLFKTKTYGTTKSDYILAYQLLKSANLSTHHEKLIKATIPDLQYNIKKVQLKKRSMMPQDRSKQKQRFYKN